MAQDFSRVYRAISPTHFLTHWHAYESLLPITGRWHIRLRGPPAALRLALDAAEPGLRPPRRLCLPAQVGICLKKLFCNMFEHYKLKYGDPDCLNWTLCPGPSSPASPMMVILSRTRETNRRWITTPPRPGSETKLGECPNGMSYWKTGLVSYLWCFLLYHFAQFQLLHHENFSSWSEPTLLTCV